MKIRTCAALLIALLAISLLAGCAAYAVEEKLDAVEDVVDHKLDTIEDAAEAAVIQAITPEPPAPQPAPAEATPVETAPPAPVETVPAETAAPAPAVTEAAPARLTKEEAQAIALEHAGFTAEQVNYLRAEFDMDDRIPQYDIEFHEDRWEYEYEIHAETGTVLSFDRDD